MENNNRREVRWDRWQLIKEEKFLQMEQRRYQVQLLAIVHEQRRQHRNSTLLSIFPD
jgi:hypothetical protein